MSRLKTAMSALAVVALLALAWFWLGPDSAIESAIAGAVVLSGMVVWTNRRKREREGNDDGTPANEQSIDPHTWSTAQASLLDGTGLVAA